MRLTPDRPAPRSRPVERYLPIAYFALAVLAVALLVPTALRPPNDQPQSSAEFDPDAPPTDNQDSLIASLSRGTSTSAGTLGSATQAAAPLASAPEAMAAVPRACPYGIGQPPRQTESVYAPPCASAFVGSNGGATWRGVSPTEVRVAVYPQLPTAQTSYSGPVPIDRQPNETPQDRTFRVFQQYFNSRFQLYQRQLRFYMVKSMSAGNGADVAAAVQADEEYKAFGIVGTGAGMHAEAAVRKLVTFGSFQNPQSYYAGNQPYTWAVDMDGTQLVRLTAEFVCKQLVGKIATFAADDPLLRGQQRKFGYIAGDTPTHRFDEELPVAFRDECGGMLAEIAVFGGENGSNANIASAVTKMKAAGVTTLIMFNNFIYGPPFTFQATEQAYFPEWIFMGGLLDDNATGRTMDPQQWRHAFGISAMEIPRPDSEQDWWRAYAQVDPDNQPDKTVGVGFFQNLQQVTAGIQRAGPRLTPASFQAGLLSVPRRPPDPTWSMGGGYAPGDYTYADYGSIVWWDPVGDDAGAPGQPGAYRHVLDGRRFAIGGVPSDPVPLFESGITKP